MTQHDSYLLFQRGRKLELEGRYEDAISTYKEYSKSLAQADQYIPFYWISSLYSKVGMEDESMKARVKYAQGCTDAGAAKLLTVIGNEYEASGKINEAIECYQEATERHDKTDLSSKISKLNDQLL